MHLFATHNSPVVVALVAVAVFLGHLLGTRHLLRQFERYVILKFVQSVHCLRTENDLSLNTYRHFGLLLDRLRGVAVRAPAGVAVGAADPLPLVAAAGADRVHGGRISVGHGPGAGLGWLALRHCDSPSLSHKL